MNYAPLEFVSNNTPAEKLLAGQVCFIEKDGKTHIHMCDAHGDYYEPTLIPSEPSTTIATTSLEHANENIPKYTICRSTDPVQVIHLINKLLNRGWDLYGTLSTLPLEDGTNEYIQAMVKNV